MRRRNCCSRVRDIFLAPDIMSSVVRIVRERKKLIFYSVLVYLVLTQFVYTGRWQLRAVITRPGVVQSMLVNYWGGYNFSEFGQLLYDITVERQTLNAETRRLKLISEQENKPLIAIGCAVTSKRISSFSEKDLASVFPFFKTLLPSFCKTADRIRFNYVFYLAYDYNDGFFSNATLAARFERTFGVEMERLCGAGTGEGSNTSTAAEQPALVAHLHLVSCSDVGKPTRAQNAAMIAAYVAGSDYFYRVNDDSQLVTGDWTRQFVATLDGHDPPRVGVVGPNHWGGNTGILTYDFVHRTHVDLFGFYYPYLFTDWWGDDWVTSVYKPNRSTKLLNVRLMHTMALGQRYGVNSAVGGQLWGQIGRDRRTIDRYVGALKAGKFSTRPSGRKVISMSLYGTDPRYSWGTIRNAQLLPVLLPDWVLRVYVPSVHQSESAQTSSSSSNSPSVNVTALTVPPVVINTLRRLGAELAWVPVPAAGNGNQLPARDWRLLAADDNNIDFLLIRDADHRLTERESTAIDEWITEVESSGSDDDGEAIHCFRDHPKHAVRALTAGLWGARPVALRRRLRGMGHSGSVAWLVANQRLPLNNSTTSRRPAESAESIVLNTVVWPAMTDVAFCHDSVSACRPWPPLSSINAFRTPAAANEYVGQKFNKYELPLNDDWKELGNSTSCNVTTEIITHATRKAVL